MLKSILIAFLLVCAPLFAQEENRWSKQDIIMESAYLAVTTVDWGQTRTIALDPKHHREGNPLLGPHPSLKKVDTLIPLSMLAHVLIANQLHGKWRTAWQAVFITVESAAITHNYSVGCKMSW